MITKQLNIVSLFISEDGVRAMVFNTTFNIMSVISWRSVLLVQEIGGPGENHPPVIRTVKYSFFIHFLRWLQNSYIYFLYIIFQNGYKTVTHIISASIYIF
jgi:hypothetical protein